MQNIIKIKGARVHNLKNIDVEIPRDKLVVITGLSGSGKSSLAFDTIYAEGQRRYVESLSAYARQFKKLKISKSPGVYQFLDKNNKIIYVGKAADLRARVFSYWSKSAGHSPAKYSMLKRIDKVEWIETDSEIEALLLEANLIKKIQPRYNIVMRDDKRYVYIKITTEDEAPGVFITRKIDKSGKYFGPFTGVEAVKQTLKAIRKIWPYCVARKQQKKPCFYYQINRCIGICGGIVGRKEYMEKVIKPIILFLRGEKGKVIKNYELRIKSYEKDLKKYKIGDKRYDEALVNVNDLKYKIINIKKVLEHAKILSVADKYANDVVELAKVLGLPKIPERIEGYDISNLFGKEATGSMVVFSGGEPDKSEYRKFKIKIGRSFIVETRHCLVSTDDKYGDTQMLREVLERRFKRAGAEETADKETKFPIGNLVSGGVYTEIKIENRKSPIENPKWPLPDLIIVDGGKQQLNVALRILKKFKFDIPVIAISKGLGMRSALAPDKLFFPGEKKPLELPLASPALHLIKRVRDEAHRFAIAYHRKLKRKSVF